VTEPGRPAPTSGSRSLVQLKNIERGFKSLAIRALAKVMRAPDGAGLSTAPHPDWSARPYRVLYLRYDRIGDMVLATGIIKAITEAQPTVTVDVLASPANARVLLGNPHVGQVLTFDRKRRSGYLSTLIAMRRGRYDAVIDAMVMAPSLTTMMLMWASGARVRIGVGDRGNEYALTLPVPRLPGALHYIDHSAALLAAFGVDPLKVRRHAAVSRPTPPSRETTSPVASPPLDAGAPSSGWDIWRPEIFPRPSEQEFAENIWAVRDAGARGASHREKGAEQKGERRERRFLVNISAGAAHRYWPSARFVEVIRHMSARYAGMRTVVVGSPADADRMQEIATGAGDDTSVASTPDYRQMMALVEAADIVLTADTSVTHIAYAFGTPAVVMCARGLAPLYGPYGTTGRTVSTPGRSLESLEVDPVVATLEAVMAGAGNRSDR
jgi:ADP-heptose:LPS heptosyltransferase